ncbi:MAG: (2Fe-2S)-binding protein [Geothrix sp.]|uniref:(2Fe-2S)-binding protein n=1 Tax=Geothrix sp. TaxID=1962974 RepID=UPI003BAF61C1
MDATVSFVLNGKPVTVSSPRDRMLVWVLRDELGLTGTKVGCEAGLCGACTVLVDSEATLSCSTAVGDVAGKSVLTIEGLALDGKLDPVQKAFQDHHAFQCGFCTSGMIMAAWAFLKKKPRATRTEIVEAMEGNICRCGAHVRILDAVESAGKAKGGVR